MLVGAKQTINIKEKYQIEISITHRLKIGRWERKWLYRYFRWACKERFSDIEF